jgi:hypothetical protein
MAKTKQFTPADDVPALINSTRPATPILSSKEKTYYKGLKRRGFSEEQIEEFIQKAGYSVPANFWIVKQKSQSSPTGV